MDFITTFDYKPQFLVTESNYDLEPTHYVSPLQLSCDAMHKQTQVTMELFTNPEMDRRYSKAMPASISIISGR